MKDFFSKELQPSSSVEVERRLSKGLAPVLCYDPWFPRALETVKQCISDGFPVLVRLHSAASYPAGLQRYLLDLESHAVLIVGYDDEKQAVSLVDPWNNHWGGNLGGRRWLPYSMLQVLCVDSTRDLTVVLAPLVAEANVEPMPKRDGFSVFLNIGFYTPRGKVMDQDSWAITKVVVNWPLIGSCSAAPMNTKCVTGHWIVGDYVKIPIVVRDEVGYGSEFELKIKATIRGQRPYEFEDSIELYKKICVVDQSSNATVKKVACAK